MGLFAFEGGRQGQPAGTLTGLTASAAKKATPTPSRLCATQLFRPSQTYAVFSPASTALLMGRGGAARRLIVASCTRRRYFGHFVGAGAGPALARCVAS